MSFGLLEAPAPGLLFLWRRNLSIANPVIRQQLRTCIAIDGKCVCVINKTYQDAIHCIGNPTPNILSKSHIVPWSVLLAAFIEFVCARIAKSRHFGWIQACMHKILIKTSIVVTTCSHHATQIFNFMKITKSVTNLSAKATKQQKPNAMVQINKN